MRTRFILSFALLLLATPAFAGIEEAQKAYDNKEWVNAIAELKPLADAGNTRALVLLGNIYNDGSGVIKDPEKAFGLYKQAAHAGFPQGMLQVGTMLQTGAVGEPQYKTASQWFHACAKLGDQACAFFYGLAAMRGDPTEKTDFRTNEIESYTWLRVAAGMETYNAMQAAAVQMATVVSGRLSTAEMKKANDFAAAFRPVDFKALGPLPDAVKP